jgi:hypothetical protein
VTAPTGGEVCYWLNDRDEIVFVNDAWGAFAAANGGEHLSAADVLGRPLWGFVADPATQHLYRQVLARVRGGRAARFTFRCDSPDCRRLMEMEVGRGPEGVTEFRSRTLSEEVRQPQALLDPARPHSGGLVRVCGWCKKVDVGGRWEEVEEAVSRLALFERPVLPRLTHGICEGCFATMTETLKPREGRG